MLLLQSSLQAAQIMDPLGISTLYIKSSNLSDESYVSNTWANSTSKVNGLIMTKCNPLECLFTFGLTFIFFPFIVIIALSVCLSPEEET